MSNCIIRYSSSKIACLFHIALFVVLDLVILCKYCSFHSEVKFWYHTLSTVICSGTLFERTWGFFYHPYQIVRVCVDTDEWLDCSWIVGPFRIIATSASREFGTNFFSLFFSLSLSKDPTSLPLQVPSATGGHLR